MRRQIYFLALLLLASLSAKSQATPTQLDSIFIVTNSELYNQLSREDIVEWNMEQIDVARSVGYIKGTSLGYLNIAKAFRKEGKYSECFEYLQLAKKTAGESADVYAIALTELEYAQYYHKIGAYGLAIQLAERSIGKFRSILNTDPYAVKGLTYAYGCLGITCIGINDPTRLILI